MKEDVFYKLGEFKDWQDQEHKFVVCTVLRSPTAETMLSTIEIFDDEDGDEEPILVPVTEFNEDGHVRALLFVGISICNPKDEWDERIGKRIAYNRATSTRIPLDWIATNNPHMFGQQVIDALLEQEANRVANNPGLFIANYNASRESYERKLLAMKEFSGLSNQEQQVVAAAAKGYDIAHLEALAEVLVGEELPLPELEEAEIV